MTKFTKRLKSRLFKGASIALLSTNLLAATGATVLAVKASTPAAVAGSVTPTIDRVPVNAVFSSIEGDLISPTFDVSRIPMSIGVGETGDALIAAVKELDIEGITKPFSDGVVTFTSDSEFLTINEDNTFIATRAGVYTITLSVTPDEARITEINDDNGLELSATELASPSINSQVQIRVTEPTFPVYRLYNPNSGQHFYTAGAYEKDFLVDLGWNFESIGWHSPNAEGNNPVYRLYNPNAGGHHYTTSRYEADHLVSVGWRDEGIAFYSSLATEHPVYRVYNPFSTGPTFHHYTESTYERDFLISRGWRDENIGWFSGMRD